MKKEIKPSDSNADAERRGYYFVRPLSMKEYILTWNWKRWVFKSAEERTAFKKYWKLEGESYSFTKP